MRKLLLASAVVLAMTATGHAGVITDFGVDPTSAAGAFNHDPATGSFDDQYTFTLAGGPLFLTIASVTNTFAQASDFIVNFTGSVVFEGANGVIGGGDDVTVIGPVSASPCTLVPNCQSLAGSAIINQAGNYFLDISGVAGSTSGYGGNLSVSQLASGAPGPDLATGLPGLLAAMAFAGILYRRKKLSVSWMP